MYKPQHPHIVEPPTKKLKLLSALSFATMAVFFVVIVVLSLQLITKNRTLNSQHKDIEVLSSTLEQAAEQLTKTKRELIVVNSLPPLNSFAQQCPGGNENDALFTPLNKTPIEGYNVALVDCRSTLGTGRSAPRVLVFRVNNDGTKEFTYGATDTEPLCISNKLPVANKLALKLLLPVCTTN